MARPSLYQIEAALRRSRRQYDRISGQLTVELDRVLDATLFEMSEEIAIRWQAAVLADDAVELAAPDDLLRMLTIVEQLPTEARRFIVPDGDPLDPRSVAATSEAGQLLRQSPVLPLFVAASEARQAFAVAAGMAPSVSAEAFAQLNGVMIGAAYDNVYSWIREISEEKEREFRDMFIDAAVRGRVMSGSTRRWATQFDAAEARDLIAAGMWAEAAQRSNAVPGSIEDMIIRSGHLPLFPKPSVRQRYYSVEEHAAMTARTEMTAIYARADRATATLSPEDLTLVYNDLNWAKSDHANVCLAATAAGVMPVDQMARFKANRSRDGFPPRHVNCACQVVYLGANWGISSADVRARADQQASRQNITLDDFAAYREAA